jgi:SAM-dependent methyltransferase
VTESTDPIADFFDRECCAGADAGASLLPGSAGITELLLGALGDAGIRGHSVLELGSGAGALSRELLARGAGQVTGFDLSPESVHNSTAAAAEAGLGDRLSYRVGDAAREQLGVHDVVVSQKVVCCYPSPDELLANSLPATRQLYALVLPESRGWMGLALRLTVRLGNVLQALRRDAFRVYLHDVPTIDATIRRAGFRQRLAQRHWSWLLLVYERG